MKSCLKKIGKGILFLGLALALLHLGLLFVRPSNDRDWSPDQAVLPTIAISADAASLQNIRDFRHRSETEYAPGYYDAEFRFEDLKRIYFIVEPFNGYKGAAHTFLSFEFEGERFLAISVEIRKEKGESFSVLKGMLRQYELMYVIADERDVVRLRTNIRKDSVFVYPVVASREDAARVFRSMLARAQALQERPEFYHTLFNNCTTNIARHVREVAPDLVGWDFSFIFPESSDRYAYDLGLLDRSLPFEETREKHRIDELAQRHGEDVQFSLRIRRR